MLQMMACMHITSLGYAVIHFLNGIQTMLRGLGFCVLQAVLRHVARGPLHCFDLGPDWSPGVFLTAVSMDIKLLKELWYWWIIDKISH